MKSYLVYIGNSIFHMTNQQLKRHFKARESPIKMKQHTTSHYYNLIE